MRWIYEEEINNFLWVGINSLICFCSTDNYDIFSSNINGVGYIIMKNNMEKIKGIGIILGVIFCCILWALVGSMLGKFIWM